MVVALSGGIAAGKSLVASCFSALGIEVIDADDIARDMVRPGADALFQIVGLFGPSILTSSGELDRAAVRHRIFSDPSDRRALENVLHPRIGAEIRRRALAATGNYILIEIPLLVETRDYRWVRRTLIVDVPESVQAERIVRRDNVAHDSARRVMAAQATRHERLAIADDVIINDADPYIVRRPVEQLHQLYSRLASFPSR